MNNLGKFIVAVVACEAIGIFGSFFTMSSISIWYPSLIKPFFSPPNWIFAPVWTLLYFLMGISFYLVWVYKSKKKQKETAMQLFAIQLFLNFIWSGIFFGLQSPLFALLDIVILLYFIVLTTKAFFKISQLAGALMIPYILWVSFAALLNAAIVLLNP